MKPFITIVVFFALCSFFAACKKTQTQSLGCGSVKLHDGIVKCNGKYISPTRGTRYYKNVPREFYTYGAHDQCFELTIFDSAGNLQRLISEPVKVTNLLPNPNVIPGDCYQYGTNIRPVNSGSNWYDSCTGAMYLHYNWDYGLPGGSKWEICDTCYF